MKYTQKLSGGLFKKSLLSGLILGLGLSVQVQAEDNPNDWPRYHRLDNGWRHSPLTQINKKNVGQLEVAFLHQTGELLGGMQTTPIIVDGVIYSGGPNNNVYAINGKTGDTIWHYKPELDPIVDEIFFGGLSRGVTVGHGNVYLGTLDGRFIALDQKTGKVKWEQKITIPKDCFGCMFSSPPQLAGDILYGGTTGGDQPTQGKIYAVNAITGEPAWTFETLKHDDEKSWPGDSGKIGGGSAWLPGQYDAESDTIFIGTSNASPDFYGNDREGDNKWTASYLAIEGKTGKLKWGHQEIPHDTFDYDSAYEGVFFKRDGKELISHLNKGGFVFVYEKDNGKLENVWQFAKNVNFVKTIDPKTGELIDRIHLKAGEENIVCPYVLGARSWNHGAYNPSTGLWYNNAQEACLSVTPAPTDPDTLGSVGALSLGVSAIKAIVPPGQEKSTARLDARDPLTGKVKWSVDYDLPGYGAVLSTAGNLIFNGDARGYVYAYDAENGEVLWKFNTGSGIRSGIVSYAVDGEQYILVPSGWGGLAPGFAASAFPGINEIPGAATLVAFKLKK